MNSQKSQNKTFSIKVSVDKKYQNTVDFYTKQHTLSKLVNVLLSECEKNKPFKFKILKELEKLKV